ncbi:MAG: hypothetical protein KJ737_06560 [Proteobacteria bacterium]|nr:hypothetical protein [Pseudomonadota bacterium]
MNDQIDTKKIDQLLQYILYVASQSDDWQDKELSMIHLIKYVYLADLEYAKFNHGKTYTGITWVFHHYGPWSVPLFKRIEPALTDLGAIKKTYESTKFEGDFKKWRYPNDGDTEYEINLIISGAIQKFVLKFGSDTRGLLDYVYKTEPMLRAAPEDVLDFSAVAIPTKKIEEETAKQELTERQKKKKKEAWEDLKKRFQEKMQNRPKKKRIKPPPPVYDDIYFEGIEYLDSLAGKDIEDSSGTITISDDLWYSEARYKPDDE